MLTALSIPKHVEVWCVQGLINSMQFKLIALFNLLGLFFHNGILSRLGIFQKCKCCLLVHHIFQNVSAPTMQASRSAGYHHNEASRVQTLLQVLIASVVELSVFLGGIYLCLLKFLINLWLLQSPSLILFQWRLL